MKLTTELALKQSFSMTTDMLLAIDILAMSALEVDQLIDEELEKNPLLTEYDHFEQAKDAHDYRSAYDIAIENTWRRADFKTILLEQVGEGRFNKIEALIAEAIIYNLDDNGFLSDSDAIIAWISDTLDVYKEWIESVRLRIMDLKPIGCGAKDINESLIHQAKCTCVYVHEQFLSILQKVKENPEQKIPSSVLNALRTDQQLIELKNLSPCPSAMVLDTNVNDGIFPDLLVKSSGDRFLISLLKKPSDRVAIKTGAALVKKNKFLQDSHRRASLVMRAIRFREHSLLKITHAIVEEQKDFFLHNAPLRPLSMRTIAKLSGMHESSISRLSRGKYLFCDRGSFELKYFFCSAINREEGEESLSAAAAKHQIKLLIDHEDKTVPLSDQKIMTELKGFGFFVSRRTIAKYREHLKIASAHKRRALIR